MNTVSPQIEVFKASAGSGKTHQLALRYICFLLGKRIDEKGTIRLYTSEERKVHREILAITFTNKATEEMKQRIIHELYCLSDSNRESKLREDILKLTGATADKLADCAREALTQLLFDFGEMQVSTIDAFFQKILRSFAYEADLGGNYELMVDSKQMIEMAIADTLSMICGVRTTTKYDRSRVKMIREWVKDLLVSQASNASEIKIFDNNSHLRSNLSDFISKLSDERYQAFKDELHPFMNNPCAIDCLSEQLTLCRVQLQEDIRRVVSDIKSRAGDSLKANAVKMLDRIAADEYDELTSTNALYFTGERDCEDGLLKKNGYTNELRNLFETLVSLVRMLHTVDVMKDQMFYLGLFREVLDIAARMKIHMNTILLSDTNTILNEIIADSDTPFIYERTGQRLHNYLIDEFQDTSLLQWKNLYPLIANSIGNGNDNMIIGDVKQCIYRFRNSYPELLDTELEEDVLFKDIIILPQLEANRRSSTDVVQFNNILFNTIAQRRNIHSYEHVSQIPYNEESGYVDICVTKQFNENVSHRMIQHIRRQLDSGYSPGKICVLVRKRKHAKQVIDALLAAGAPGEILAGVQVVSDEALYVSASKAVGYIISQLRLLDRVQQDPKLIPVSKKTGLPKTTEHEMDWLRDELHKLNSQGVTGFAAVEAILNEFDQKQHLAARNSKEDIEWRVRTRGRSVFEVVEELIQSLPDDNLRITEAQYISAFQDLIVEYCRNNSPTIHGFLKLWDEQHDEKAAIGLPVDSDAIRVMTIHKAKGLEFDCVHVPLYGDKLDKENNYRWFSSSEIFDKLDLKCETPSYFPLNSGSGLKKTLFSDQYDKLCEEQFLDQLNVMYVAFTRAKYELIVTADASPSSAGDLIIDALRDEFQEVNQGHFVYTKGSPTVIDSKITPEENDGESSLNLHSYRVYDRLDTWHSTNPVTESDSGEIL